MAINQAVERHALDVAYAQVARVAADGLARHDHALALANASGPQAARDLADAVHLLCSLYGRHPGLVELALGQTAAGPVRDWLAAASDAIERERLYLVRLAAAVGPLPSTPGSAETEAVLGHQRHAIETLALSERRGCALGATTALIADWGAVRGVLNRAAVRMGVDVPPCSLPDAAGVVAVIEAGSRAWRPSVPWPLAESSCCSRIAACSTSSKPAPKPAATAEPPLPLAGGD